MKENIGTIVYIGIVVLIIMMSSCSPRPDITYNYQEISEMEDEMEAVSWDYAHGRITYLEWENIYKPRVYTVNEWYESK
jgi:hypothetical protein